MSDELDQDLFIDDEETEEGEGVFDGIDTVSLFDEEGNEYEFELLDYVDYNEKLYAVMIPTELYEDDTDEQVVIMETFFEDNEPNFVFVDDEKLAQQILDLYEKQAAEREEE